MNPIGICRRKIDGKVLFFLEIDGKYTTKEYFVDECRKYKDVAPVICHKSEL